MNIVHNCVENGGGGKMDKVTLDKRGSARRKLLLHGIVSDPNRPKKNNCIIRNGTKEGCMIMLADLSELPPQVDLIIEEIGKPIRCSVVWRDRYSVGLKFLGRAAGK